jgi:MFS transporter, UMF1 family
MQTASKKVITAWTMYDWANSVYNLVITSTIFPAYYESMTGDGDPLTPDRIRFLGLNFDNVALYNYALSFAFLIVSILSPLLSSIADIKGNKKSFLRFFMTMGSLACSALFFFNKDNLWLGLSCTIVACIGFWSSLVFYNSYLPEIAAPEDRDKISARGFSMGYIGSVILQLISFVLILKSDLFGITAGRASQISFFLVGIWWFGFGQWTLRVLPNPAQAGQMNGEKWITKGYRELGNVWNILKKMPVLKSFLASYFFYNMGLQTVMLAASLYAASELGIPTINLMISILLIQMIAIPGAFVISRLSGKIGNIPAIMVCVSIWIALCYMGYAAPTRNVNYFYVLASLVGFVMGGTQALSRSTYAKLMPVTKDTASFFSFFDVSEKIGNVIGLFQFGFLAEVTGSQRISVLSCMVFFIIGLMLLFITRKRISHETVRG